jgi:hypothetical protein
MQPSLPSDAQVCSRRLARFDTFDLRGQSSWRAQPAHGRAAFGRAQGRLRPAPTKAVWASLIVLLALTSAVSAFAQQPVADAVIQRGIIKVRRENREHIFRDIGLKIPLYETDVVHSGKDTRAVITVRETGESITLFADSHFAVAEVGKLQSRFQLAIGKALFLVRRAEDLVRETTVQTATATVGVKGTEFVVGAKEDESYVMTVDGTVSVHPSAAPQREVKVLPGQAYYAGADQAPTGPVQVTAEQQRRVLNEEGLDALRKASGAPDRGPAPVYEPLGLGARMGLGYQRIELPITGGKASKLAVNSFGVVLGMEFSLLGPVTLDVTGFRGGVDSTEGGSEQTRPPDGGGAVSSLSGMLGARGSLGHALSWALHAGLYQEAIVFRRDEGEPLDLGLRGPIARAELDYRLSRLWFLGFSFGVARVEASGSLVDRLREQGVTAHAATVQIAALTAGTGF